VLALLNCRMISLSDFWVTCFLRVHIMPPGFLPCFQEFEIPHLFKSDISIVRRLGVEKHVWISSRNTAIPHSWKDSSQILPTPTHSHQRQPLGSNRCFGLWCYCLSSCILALNSLTLPAIVPEGHKDLRFIVLGMSGICGIQVPTWPITNI